jgi:long-chain acyl-CoA synthetase
MALLVTEIADARPDVPALIDEWGTTTWAELAERVNRLIHGLRAAGIGQGDVIAMLSGNRREYYEAFLAAGHMGVLIVPVNWHWVAGEVAYVLGNSGAKALLVEDRFAEVASAALVEQPVAIRIAVGDSADGYTPFEDVLASGSGAEPEDQALGGPMFYTSGTTGWPKGVRLGMMNGSLPVEFLRFYGDGFSQSMHAPVAGMTYLNGPVYHSAQWAFSMLPLLKGSGVVMRQKFEAAEALRIIDEHSVTNTHLVPTQMIRLLKLPDDVRAEFDGGSLEIVWHGAAPCPPDVKRRMIEWWGPKVWEYYGATEGGVVSLASSEEWLERPGTVGKPGAINEVHILDDDGNELPVGQSGTIWIKNLLGMDFEYHDDPEKTAKAHREPSVFTLGDIGYVDDAGYLYMSDRKIDMIISGGVNIYPAEIEGVLVTHPAVRDAAVFGVPNDEFGEEVKAAIELNDGVTASAELVEEVLAHCRGHLAGYKVPRSIDVEEALPRHPTGKLYKRLLRDPYWEGAGRSI